MQFANGGSQLGFLPKNLAAAALPHMGQPPDTSFLNSVKSFAIGGENPSAAQTLGKTALITLAAHMLTGGMSMPYYAIPAIASAASLAHNRFFGKKDPYKL